MDRITGFSFEGKKIPAKVEGEEGTWSHCGKRTPHTPHFHSFAMNEGLYENIKCLGTPGVPSKEDREREILSKLNKLRTQEAFIQRQIYALQTAQLALDSE